MFSLLNPCQVAGWSFLISWGTILQFLLFAISFQDIISKIMKKVFCHFYFRTSRNMQYEYRGLFVSVSALGIFSCSLKVKHTIELHNHTQNRVP